MRYFPIILFVVAVIVCGEILTEVVLDVPVHPFASTTDKL